MLLYIDKLSWIGMVDEFYLRDGPYQKKFVLSSQALF